MARVDHRDLRVRDASHANDALVEQFLQRADRVRVGDIGIGAVKLVQPNRLDSKPQGGRLRRLLEVRGVPVAQPRAIAGANQAALGRDKNVVRVTAI